MYASNVPNHFKLFRKQCNIAGLLQLHWMVVINLQSHIWTIDSGENMFNLSSNILSTLCPNWTEKLIGITTDGASNMTGCHAGLATRIERVANAGFFCVWCAAHQLDLVVQARFKSMFNERFVHVIQGITGYLRRQKNLITSMKSTCPRFIDTQWLSMGRLLDWLIAKRLPLQAYFEERQPPC
jgi:hypothetical protein